ncbi:MAG: translocation/assembly module TamB domain-containing protein [Dysgonamonadaceae bacterium]|jgi:hypothetical protein|nr:translocation/assembly module TamB domain-containing protein [Dysgonamonadaceae bacterium]
MKTFKYTIRILLCFLTVFYLLPAVALQIPYIQQEISTAVTGYLEKKLNTEIHIDHFELKPFNKLTLKNVFLKDQAGDTLFTAKRISAGFDLIPLFKKKFRFHSVQLFSFNLHLNRENPEAPLNIQYIIDAFRSDDNEENAPVEVNIKNVNLRRGNLTYRVKTAAPTPGLFHPDDLHLQAISAKISLENLDRDAWDIRLDKLSLTEKSGFRLQRLSFHLNTAGNKARIDRLNMELPSSKVQITDIQLDYSRTKTLEEMPVQISIEPSTIYLKDLAPLVPALAHYDNKIACQGDLSGTINDFSFDNFLFRDNDELFLKANGQVENIASSDPDRIHFTCHVSESMITSSAFQQLMNNNPDKKTEWPEQIQNLGTVFFNGEVSGNFNNLNASGVFDTNVGCVDVNVIWGKSPQHFIRGQIASENLNLKQLTANDNFGQAAFKININTILNDAKHWSGNVGASILSFDYEGYNYKNIDLSGNFTQSGFNGSLSVDDANGKLIAGGAFVLNGDNSEFKFSAQATNIHLKELNFTDKYPNSKLSFIVSADFTGNSIDKLLGNIHLNQISFSTANGSHTIDNLIVRADMQDTIKEIRIFSDIINGEITGAYSLKSFLPEIKQTLSLYLSSLFRSNTPEPRKQEENNFSFRFTLNSNENLISVLELPFTLYGRTELSGSYNSLNNTLLLEADIPQIETGGATLEAGKLKLNGMENNAQLKLNGVLLQKKNRINLDASFTAKDNTIHSLVLWDNAMLKKHKGKLEFTTDLSRTVNPESLTARIDVKPSQVVFNDSAWTLSPTSITINPGKIEIDNFKVQHENQRVEIQGNISHDANEQLWVELNEVDLTYVFQALNIKALDFGGIATGKALAKDLYHTRQLTTDLDVTDFTFNKTMFGRLLLNGSWDEEKQGIKMTGNVIKNDSSSVNINGMIYPVKEELSILFDSKNADAAFLRKYLHKVVQDFSGQITGPLRLFGELNHPTIEGTVHVENGKFKIKFLNTYYTFSDTVRCTPERIAIRNMALYDEHQNKAIADGYIQHRQLDDFRFAVKLDFDHFMAFNAGKNTNPVFFGTVFGSGKATLNGTEDLVNINVSMQNNDNSKMTLNFMEEPDVAEYNFIHFINEKDSIPAGDQTHLAPVPNRPAFTENNSGTEVRLTLSLGITPGAAIDVIMNPLTGDKISAYGSGHLDIQYGTSTPLKVMGNYKFEKGKYNFSLQQVIIRNFDIGEGSAVTFRGDPYAAELDLNAAYTVSANLGDLDERLFLLSARNNVPVNCILLLKGPLNQPAISFDLDLPGSTSELTRQVKSYIRTDDMMNRQILYLLVLSRFYTSPEYIRSESRLNNDLSFLTSTLSSQLSNLLGSLSDNFQIGTTFHQAYEGERTNTEVELLLSSTLLNNRLIINGNFGYINNMDYYDDSSPGITQNNVPLVGDLDIEYKLTPSGNIRLKGFNHYNYRNYYSITPEWTQGIGILFRKDFNYIRDLLGIKN